MDALRRYDEAKNTVPPAELERLQVGVQSLFQAYHEHQWRLSDGPAQPLN